jgi:hypothetical protein
VLLECINCWGGQLEVRDHDCFDYLEAWEAYGWFTMEHEGMDLLRDALRACRQLTLVTCECDTHRSLREDCRSLPFPTWDGAVSPAFADRERIARNCSSAVVSIEPDGMPTIMPDS